MSKTFPAQGPWFAVWSGRFWDIQTSTGPYGPSFATVHINPYIGMTAEDASSAARMFAAAPETAAERDRLKAANAALVSALRRAERELACAENGSVGGAPNTVALLIPEALEVVRGALAAAE